MNIDDFNILLKSRKIPHTAWLRFKPIDMLKEYTISSVIAKRGRSNRRGNDQVVSIHKDIQIEIFKKLCINKPSNHIVAISGVPNDILAQQCAMTIVYNLINKYKIHWEFVNTGFINTKFYIDPNVIILYNIIPEKERLYQIRDFLDSYPNSLRLVIISGTTGLDYFDNYLKYPLSGMIHFTSGHSESNRYIKLKPNSIDYPVFNEDLHKLKEVL